MDWLDVFLHIGVHLIIIKIFDPLLLNHWSEPIIILKFWSLKAYSLMLIVLISILVQSITIRDILKSHPLLCLVFSFFKLLIRVKHIENRVSSAHEVGMVCVDIRVLNFNKILDHSVRWKQVFVQKLHHRVIYLPSETLKSYKLRHIYIHNYSSQLFEYHLHALQRW